MPRPATLQRWGCLLAAGLWLSGCHYASSPLVGFGGFIANTHTFRANPNAPPGSAENVRRVQGQQVAADPLLPEPGNIWPGQPKAEMTLEDVIRDEQPGQPPNGPLEPGAPSPAIPPGSSAHPQPRPGPRGSGGTPPSVDFVPQPSTPVMTPTAPPAITVPPASIATPSGVQPLTRGGNGVTSTTAPGGGTSIVVPNGNGTSTVIAPDGSTSVVPTPR